MLSVERVDVWSASLDDRVGALKDKLEGLAMAGADLQFLIARRLHDGSGKGVVFLTPLAGNKQITAAQRLGFTRTDSLHSLRVQGPDEPGVAYRILAAMSQENINLRGVSAATLNKEFVVHLAFDNETDASKAEARLALPI